MFEAPLKSYINGQWVLPLSSQQTQDAINPATEEVCATIALCGPDDADRAVAAARAAQPGPMARVRCPSPNNSMPT